MFRGSRHLVCKVPGPTPQGRGRPREAAGARPGCGTWPEDAGGREQGARGSHMGTVLSGDRLGVKGEGGWPPGAVGGRGKAVNDTEKAEGLAGT